MNNHILSGFADEFDKDIHAQLSMLRENGVQYFEPRAIRPGLNVADLTADQAKELKAEMDENGIKASAIGSPLGKIKLSDDMDAHMEKAKRTFETANILGTPFVRMFSFYAPEGKTFDGQFDAIVENLSRMADIADQFGVTLCHENEHDVYGEGPQECLDVIKASDGKIKAVFDMGNFVLCGHDPLKAYELLKDYVVYFHIKDSTYNGAIVPPGCGEAKIKEILSMHKESTFVSLEPHLATFEALKTLTKTTYDNPYVYENKQVAYLDALKRIREILA